MKPEIEIINDQIVGIQGTFITVMRPKMKMTKVEALRHAAWLVALADESGDNSEFKRVLDAIYFT